MTKKFERKYFFFCVLLLCDLIQSTITEPLEETNSVKVVVGDIGNNGNTKNEIATNEKETKDIDGDYPQNIGLWEGWGSGNKSICVRLHAAIRMTLPVEFNDGFIRWMNLDIQPTYAKSIGHCFNPNRKTLSLQWMQNDLSGEDYVKNNFSMSFKLSPDGNYTLDGLGVSYYNRQFSRHASDVGRVELNATNLNFFPITVNHSYACTLTKTQIEMRVHTDDRRNNFTISMFSIQWEAYWDRRNKTAFDPIQYECEMDKDDSVPSFTKVFLISTLVVLVVCFAILSLLMCLTLYFLRRCRPEQTEGYETLS